MAKIYKPGFMYIKSETIKQEIAMSIKNGRVYCEDGIQYSPKELLLFFEEGVEIDVGTHIAKGVFGGEVVKVGKAEGTNQGESVEGKGGNGTGNNQNPCKELPGTDGNGAGRETN
jgi:hypothetical protein